MASFSSLFQDNGSRSRCDSDASNFSESSKRKAREDFSPAAKSSRVDLVELEDSSSAEDSQSTEENLMALEGMINRVQAIFEKLKVNIEEADLNPKLSAILTDMCSALTITNTAQVELIGLAKTRSFRQSRPAQRISSNSVPRNEVRNPPAGLASAREILHNRAPLCQGPLSDNTPWTTVGKGGKHITPPEIVVTKETSSRPAMTTEVNSRKP
jgi:hypothetical protein